MCWILNTKNILFMKIYGIWLMNSELCYLNGTTITSHARFTQYLVMVWVVIALKPICEILWSDFTRAINNSLVRDSLLESEYNYSISCHYQRMFGNCLPKFLNVGASGSCWAWLLSVLIDCNTEDDGLFTSRTTSQINMKISNIKYHHNCLCLFFSYKTSAHCNAHLRITLCVLIKSLLFCLVFDFLEISFNEGPVAKFNKLCEPDIPENINFVL